MMADAKLSNRSRSKTSKDQSDYGYITEMMFDAAMINMTESNNYEEEDTDEDDYASNLQGKEKDPITVGNKLPKNGDSNMEDGCHQSTVTTKPQPELPEEEMEDHGDVSKEESELIIEEAKFSDDDLDEEEKDTCATPMIQESSHDFEHECESEEGGCNGKDMSLTIKEEMLGGSSDDDDEARVGKKCPPLEKMECDPLREEVGEEDVLLPEGEQGAGECEPSCEERQGDAALVLPARLNDSVSSGDLLTTAQVLKPSLSSTTYLPKVVLKPPSLRRKKVCPPTHVPLDKEPPPHRKDSLDSRGSEHIMDSINITEKLNKGMGSDSTADALQCSGQGSKDVDSAESVSETVNHIKPTGNPGKGDATPPASNGDADLFELLTLGVPKDFVNCVWSNDTEIVEGNDILNASSVETVIETQDSHTQNSSSENLIEAVDEDYDSDEKDVLKKPDNTTQSNQNSTEDKDSVPVSIGAKPRAKPSPAKGVSILKDSDMRARLAHTITDVGKGINLVNGSSSATTRPAACFKIVHADSFNSKTGGRTVAWPKGMNKSKGHGLVPIENLTSVTGSNLGHTQINGMQEIKTDVNQISLKPLSTVRIVQPADVSYLSKAKEGTLIKPAHRGPKLRRNINLHHSVILSSPLPRYYPKDADLKNYRGKLHTCSACGDTFTLEISLQQHLARRSAVFSFFCHCCSAHLVFHNRCLLIQHYKMHGFMPDSIELADVNVSPLSDSGLEYIGSGANLSGLSKCPECGKEVRSLPSHMESKDGIRKTNITFHCPICSQFLPSACALTAHKRIHQQLSPHVCPECGQDFDVWECLLKHFRDVCCHVNRKTAFTCPLCRMVIFKSFYIEQHIISRHMKEVFKCSSCYVACFSMESLQTHRQTVHSDEPTSSLEQNIYLQSHGYFTCGYCPNQLILKDTQQIHAGMHSKDPKCYCIVYQCDDCPDIYSSKDLLLAHRELCKSKSVREKLGTESPEIVNRISGQGGDVLFSSSQSECPEGASLPTTVQIQSHSMEQHDKAPSPVILDSGNAPLVDVAEEAPSMEDNSRKVTAPKKKSGQSTVLECSDRYCIMCNARLDSSKGFDLNLRSFLANYCLPCWNNARSKKAKLQNGKVGALLSPKSNQEETKAKKIMPRKDRKSSPKEKKSVVKSSEKKDKVVEKIDKNEAKEEESERKENRKKENGVQKIKREEKNGKFEKNEVATSKAECEDFEAKQKKAEYLVCKICRELISKDSDKRAVRNHFIEKHRDIFVKAYQYGKTTLQSGNSKISYKLPIQKVSTQNLSPATKSKISHTTSSPKKRKLAPKHEDTLVRRPENNALAGCGSSPNKKSKRRSSTSNESPRIGQSLPSSDEASSAVGNLCYKCAFTTNDAEEFQIHILTHKVDTTDLQCPACGMCFIVRPPLEKHLLVHHRIKNVKEYLSEHGLADRNIEDKNEKNDEPLEANQCKVCREKFENALLLEKHFRIHGGAFLLANQKAKKS